MKLRTFSIAIAVLTIMTNPPALKAQTDGGFVTREEYEKLKRDFERMKALVEELEKRLARQTPTETATRQELVQMKKQLKQVRAEAREARKQAKASRPGGRKFLITGYGFAGFSNGKHTDSSFNAGFNPIFLWKLSRDIFFEGEAEFELEGGETHVSLEFAQISYLFNDYLTLGVGKFLNPANYFVERLHPPWINKLPDQPLSVSAANRIQPRTLVGAQARGALPLRFLGLDGGRLGYAFYVANGAKMNDDGTLNFQNFTASNSSKLVGGRIGLVPLAGLAIGYGFELGRVRDPFLSKSRDLSTHVVDINYVRTSRAIQGRIDLRGQWAWRDVENSPFLPFDNEINGGYGQIAYRPSLANLGWIRNLEGVFRFDRLDQPGNSGLYDENRYTVGMNYYFNPTTLFKFAYQFDDRRNAKDNDMMLFQVATGF